MIDPKSEEYQMADEDKAEIEQEYEIFYSEEGVKKVRTAGGNVYPQGTPEYEEVTGEKPDNGDCKLQCVQCWHLTLCVLSFQLKLLMNSTNIWKRRLFQRAIVMPLALSVN